MIIQYDKARIIILVWKIVLQNKSIKTETVIPSFKAYRYCEGKIS